MWVASSRLCRRLAAPLEIQLDRVAISRALTSVETTADYGLVLAFENGERRRFDMTPLLQRKAFVELQPQQRFAQARVEYGTVVWPGDIDFAPETLCARSVPI
jgi:hypothetical protein